MTTGTAGQEGAGAPRPAPDFDALSLAKTLLRSVGSGALATLDAQGAPFSTLTTVATDTDGRPLLLLSQLAAHTRHLAADSRASLLLARIGRGDPLAHPRLTLNGRVSRLEPRDAGRRARAPSFPERSPQGRTLRRLCRFRLLAPRSRSASQWGLRARGPIIRLRAVDRTSRGASPRARRRGCARAYEWGSCGGDGLYATALLGEAVGPLAPHRARSGGLRSRAGRRAAPARLSTSGANAAGASRRACRPREGRARQGGSSTRVEGLDALFECRPGFAHRARFSRDRGCRGCSGLWGRGCRYRGPYRRSLCGRSRRFAGSSRGAAPSAAPCEPWPWT